MYTGYSSGILAKISHRPARPSHFASVVGSRFTFTISLSWKEEKKLLSYGSSSNLKGRKKSMQILFATGVAASLFSLPPIYCPVYIVGSYIAW